MKTTDVASDSLIRRLWSAQFIGHPFVWLIVTILLLLAGFFWLQLYVGSYALTSAEIKDPALVKKQPGIEAVNQTIVRLDNMEITHPLDKQRSKNFLVLESIENSINPLLEKASEYIDNDQLVLPENTNAWHKYKEVLKIDAENKSASSGLLKISSILVDRVESALENNSYEHATYWLEQLAAIEPGEDLLNELREEIDVGIKREEEIRRQRQDELERQTKVISLLNNAATLNTSDPDQQSYLINTYHEVLELDSDNETAKSGLSAVVEHQLDWAEEYLRNRQPKEAAQIIENARSLDAENYRFSALQQSLESEFKRSELEEKQLQRTADGDSGTSSELMPGRDRLHDAQLQSAISQSTRQPAGAQRPEVARVIGSSPKSVVSQQAENLAFPPPKVVTKAREQLLRDGIKAYYTAQYNRAYELLYPLAEQGIARAQFRIGMMYQIGRSVGVDLNLAKTWMTRAMPAILKAAQQGVAWAQSDLGTIYETGVVMNKDMERTIYWYNKAAEQDYSGAQTNLGVIYATGDGVEFSRRKALFWLRKAAVKGDEVARANLRILGESYQ